MAISRLMLQRRGRRRLPPSRWLPSGCRRWFSVSDAVLSGGRREERGPARRVRVPRVKAIAGRGRRDHLPGTSASACSRCGRPDPVPLGNSVSCRELGFCCEISGMAESISRSCCRSPTGCSGGAGRGAWPCWSGLTCPRMPSCWCCATRTRCCAASWPVGCGGVMVIGKLACGAVAAGGPAVGDLDVFPVTPAGDDLGAGTVTSSPASGTTPAAPARAAVHWDLGQDAGRPDGAGQPALGPPEDPSGQSHGAPSGTRTRTRGPSDSGSPVRAPVPQPRMGVAFGDTCRVPSREETNVRLPPCALEALAVVAARRLPPDEAVRRVLGEHVGRQEEREPDTG